MQVSRWPEFEDESPRFSVEEVEEKEIVYLLCGSGNAAYTIEK